MMNKTQYAIIGLIALLPLLAVLLFYVDIINEKTSIKVVIVIGVTLSSYYGIIKLATPLAEEVKVTGVLK